MKLKTIIAASLIFSVLFMVSILGLNGANPLKATPSNGSGTGTPTGTASTLDAALVAKHNSETDCWMILDGKVYDFTNFLPQHPGGKAVMALFCGKDGTAAYATKNRLQGRPHSTFAGTLHPPYLIGLLGSPLNATGDAPATHPATDSTQLPPPPAPNIPPPAAPKDVTLDMAEIAKHGSSADCWMVLHGKVYDFTSYIPYHPGGFVMALFCGKDGTTAYDTKNRIPGMPHSSQATSSHSAFYLGDLDQKLSADTLSAKLNASSAAAANTGGGEDGDGEREWE